MPTARKTCRAATAGFFAPRLPLESPPFRKQATAASVVTIRLARHGGKKNPFYHITVAEKSAKRDGRFIERIGFYNPTSRGKEERLRMNLERLDHWLAVGAQPTERVAQLIRQWRKQAPLAAAASIAEAATDEALAAEPA